MSMTRKGSPIAIVGPINETRPNNPNHSTQQLARNLLAFQGDDFSYATGYSPSNSNELDPSASLSSYSDVFKTFKRSGTGTVYEFDHFSGSQVQIYLGSVLLDDINFIQFNVSSPPIPIYGYASRFYDALARGNTIVSGVFCINFKETAYLQVITDYLQGKKELRKGIFDGVSPIDNKNSIQSKSIQHILSGASSKTVLDKETGLFLNISNSSLFDDDIAFESAAEALEDEIWKENPSDIVKRFDQLPPFDIYISYGDKNNDRANHTVHRLFHVTLSDISQSVGVSGDPIQEVYSFIARDYR